MMWVASPWLGILYRFLLVFIVRVEGIAMRIHQLDGVFKLWEHMSKAGHFSGQGFLTDPNSSVQSPWYDMLDELDQAGPSGTHLHL